MAPGGRTLSSRKSGPAVISKERIRCSTTSPSGEAIMRNALIGLIGATALLCSSAALAQSARDIRGPAGVVPLASEPAAKIVIDPPLADSLVHGRGVIQYPAENLRIVQGFGPAAPTGSPRSGPSHVTLDAAPC